MKEHKLFIFLILFLTVSFSFSCKNDNPNILVEDEEVLLIPEKISKNPTANSLRVIYLIPKGEEFNRERYNAIKNTIIYTRNWYREVLNGYTFRINREDTIEIVEGLYKNEWYTNQQPDGYPEWPDWYCLENAKREIQSRLGMKDWDPTFKWAIYIEAEGRGGASSGMTLLSRHDINGLMMDPPDWARDASVLRWYGGFAHEFSHTWDLPDLNIGSKSIMDNYGFFHYPDATFIEAERTQLFKGEVNANFMVQTDPPFSGELYKIVLKSTGDCVEINDGSVDSGANLKMGTFSNKNYQSFFLNKAGDSFYKIFPSHNEDKKAIDYCQTGSIKEGASIIQNKSIASSSGQLFSLLENDMGFLIVNKETLLAWTVDSEGSLILTKPDAGINQIFDIVKIR